MTLDLSQSNWRSVELQPGQSQIVYVLSDKTTGEPLKVGKTSVDSYKSRFGEYVTAGNKWGRQLKVDMYTLRKRAGKTIEVFEAEIRAGMEKAGFRLPWDNTSNRLRKTGSGIPIPKSLEGPELIDMVEADKPVETTPASTETGPHGPARQESAPAAGGTTPEGTGGTSAPVEPATEQAAMTTEDKAIVEKFAATQGMRVRGQGGFVTIEGMTSVVLLFAGAYLFIGDVRAHGIVDATENFAIGTVMFKGIQYAGGLAGVKIGLVGGLAFSVLLEMPDDQGARYHEGAKVAEIATQFIHQAFPGVLTYVGNTYCLRPFDWPCIEVNSPWQVNDPARFSRILPAVMELVRHPFVLEKATTPVSPDQTAR